MHFCILFPYLNLSRLNEPRFVLLSTGQNTHLVFKIQVLAKAMVSKFSFIFWPFQIVFTFFSPLSHFTPPSLYIPISFSQPETWL